MSDLGAGQSITLRPGTYRLVPADTSVRFTVTGLTGPVSATVPASSGTFLVDDTGQLAEAALVLDAAGIGGNGPIVRALRGRSGFAVDRFPTITFASTAVTTDAPRFTAVGTLTIRDVAREVTFSGEIVRARPRRFVATIEGSIDRTVFGVTVGRPLYTKVGQVRLRTVATRDGG